MQVRPAAQDGTSAGNKRRLGSVGMSPMRYPAQLPDMAPPAEAGDGPPGGGRRHRWRAALIAVVTAVVLVAGSVWWAVAAPGTYGRSHAGCVTASVPSTTGGVPTRSPCLL